MNTLLVQQFHDLVSSSIDEEGVYPAPGIILTGNDETIMLALAMDSPDCYLAFFKQIRDTNAKEAIFALDRFTKPGQGTQYEDVMCGQHYQPGIGTVLDRTSYRPFIIEYQHDPRIVGPLCWDNTFWSPALSQELIRMLGQFTGI